MKKIFMILVLILTLTACQAEPVLEEEEPEIPIYTVTFESLNDTVYEPIMAEENTRIDLPIPTKEGHYFKGWFLDQDNYHYEFDHYDVVINDMTLYAKWEAHTYTVTFNRMDGEYQAPHSYKFGDTLDGFSVPKRLGYHFEGWYADTDFNEVVQVGEAVTSDMTLYAKWIRDLRYDEDVLYFENAITEMLQTVRTSVLGIRNIRSEGEDSTGSGVIYKKEGNTYYVVTNHHVLRNHDALEIVYEKNGLLFEIKPQNITYVGSDPITDVGLITFTSSETFYTVDFADTYQLSLGQFVYAIGSPLGFTYYNSVTSGVVSGLTRFMETGELNTSTIQHDAAISPGNSGGALFNTHGELIGINTLKIVRSDVEGLGFAVPANTIVRILADLEETGEVIRPFLGVSANALVSTCNQDFGVCIADIIEGSSADELGLIANDVIVGYKTESMEDYLVIQNFDQLREAILNSRVGEHVSVRYIRDGVTYESEYSTLVVHPDDQ